MSHKVENIGAKPSGFKGRFSGLMMNARGGGKYEKIIREEIIPKIDIHSRFSVLDAGCGGGKVVKIFSSILQDGRICGIDHSPDMVGLSKNVNKKDVLSGKVEIALAGVNQLPYHDDRFHIVTAFDTINFWDNADTAFGEIKRVLKEKGSFYIVNGYPKEGTKWYRFVKFKTGDAYKEALSEQGFKNIDIKIENNTIILRAGK